MLCYLKDQVIRLIRNIGIGYRNCVEQSGKLARGEFNVNDRTDHLGDSTRGWGQCCVSTEYTHDFCDYHGEGRTAKLNEVAPSEQTLYSSGLAIAQETIDAVRRQVSIVSVIGDRIPLERRGNVYLGLCPFHKEKTPSFNVNSERGSYYCFGCHASGNVISFVQQLDGLSFPETVRELAEQAGIEFKESGSNEDRKQEAEARRRRDELYSACNLAAEYFEICLTDHPLSKCAQAELRRRQLTPETVPNVGETLKAFRVGYAPYGWTGLVEFLRRKSFNLRAAEEVGLIGQRKSGGGHYDRFRHRLMFAIVDLRGRVVAFSGRALEEPMSADLVRCQLMSAAGAEPPPKYYNSPESSIYRKREEVFGLYQARQMVRRENSCVMVEGNFDVVSLHARGIGHVVAPLGTAFTAEQAAQIARYSTKVTFLFDGDAAGHRATRAAREPCKKLGLLPKVASLPAGKDPDDLIREGGSEGIRRILGGARPLLEYLIDGALESGFAAGDAQARAVKIREVGELISSEEDPVVRSMAERHADEVAGRLGILAGEDVRGFRAFHNAMRRASGPAPQPSQVQQRTAPPESARSRSRVEAIAHQVLGAALEYPALLEDPDLAPALEPVEGELALALTAVRLLWRSAVEADSDPDEQRRNWDPPEISQKFPEACRNLVVARLTVPQIRTEEAAKNVLRDNLAKMRRLHQRVEQAGVVQDLLKASASGDTESEMSLLEKQLARARARHGLS